LRGESDRGVALKKNILLFGPGSPSIPDNGGSFSPIAGLKSALYPPRVIGESGGALSSQCRLRILGGLEFLHQGQQALALREVVERGVTRNARLNPRSAIAVDAVCVTDNSRHFIRIPGLTIENWLRAT